ncbi:hypothetical protein PI125_g26168 [Phytophthora idaei]|nr:hypothetical protein PI125_g26168 [Phytophthora idaei]KAG3163124.1 hypothetical protein PI126_g5696 [Phytophthora idaei]
MKDLSRLRLNDIRELEEVLMSLLKRENDSSPEALLNSSGTKGTPTVAAMLDAEAKAGLNKTDRAVASDASTTDSARILDVHRG